MPVDVTLVKSRPRSGPPLGSARRHLRRDYRLAAVGRADQIARRSGPPPSCHSTGRPGSARSGSLAGRLSIQRSKTIAILGVNAADGREGALLGESFEVGDDRLRLPQHAQGVVLVEDVGDEVEDLGADRLGALLPVGAAALTELGAELGQVPGLGAARAALAAGVRDLARRDPIRCSRTSS